MNAKVGEAGAAAVTGVVVGEAPVKLWGMTSAERLRRSLARAGARLGGLDEPGPAVLLRADWVLDESLVKALLLRPGAALVSATGEAVAVHAAEDLRAAAERLERGEVPQGLAAIQAETLVPAYNAALRKRAPPLMARLTAESLPSVERRMFDGSYKGVTDFVTKHVWPRPAQAVTKLCAVAGMTPNQVTAIGAALTLAAFWLFFAGHFGWGLVCAWAMTFLDTVDGKLARVTLTSSKIGNVFDHGIDLIHPPFWWWAWIAGVQLGDHPLANPHLIALVVVGGYVAQRVEEGVFLAAFKLEMHAWRRFDSWFRLITARRNPNLVLLTFGALAGRPDLGMAAVAAWTGLCFLVHALQIVQAAWARRRGPITSWMAA